MAQEAATRRLPHSLLRHLRSSSRSSLDTTMSLTKPVMRGLLTSQIKRQLVIATVLSGVAVAGWKILVQNPRKQLYADFYKDYDAQAEFDRIRNLGLFQSCRPDGEEAEE
ncbi:cytochrome c oxidase subunit 6C-1-like [Homarus americanus]|uniref:Cytochrome c oxidase subunit 6C-1-like n=1 Tax=Homarus americanus TaxID=6706 RepID=A0A8J5MNC8_HOMAM|nr:cytochrome c oxidase subunit 6C-1-like [Homarus americanus]KAG7157774.1 Cytochrome c oxidase subunit 6C-1-like [Homarus americanus]